MSRVPIPNRFLEEANASSSYRVFASLNVTLGAAVANAAATSRQGARGNNAEHGLIRAVTGKRKARKEASDRFQFFGNTFSSKRVELGQALKSAGGAGDGCGMGPGCAGMLVTRAGSGIKLCGDSVLCGLDLHETCQLCVHSNQPLKNVNLVAELIITLVSKDEEVDVNQESICWTIIPLS
jgi:hypothetical protein